MPTGHAVIDGSNLATEGRSEPSLAQLDEAVRSIDAEYDFAQITVIVDATFEHRVAKSEAKAARKAIDDGDVITPPAGVIGRGDAFILEVADRAGAVVFSNDSFQELHGTYRWLFDEGRLIGGKPIPNVGWVYVARSPVRGPVSRKATARTAKSNAKKTAKKTAKKAEPKTAEPKKTAKKTAKKAEPKTAEPKKTAKKTAKKAEPKTAEPKKTAKKTAKKAEPKTVEPKKTAKKTAKKAEPKTVEPKKTTKDAAAKATLPRGDDGNDPTAWNAFKADYPIGSAIAAHVDRFSSHGAYASVGDVEIYLPNRLLGDPPPDKARDVVDLGATTDFVVHRYDTDRHGIDAGLIAVPGAPTKPDQKTTAKKTAKKATTKKKAPAKTTAAKKTAAKKTAGRR